MTRTGNGLRSQADAHALHTARLELLPASRELLAAELNDRATLAALLDAHVPINWPAGIYDDGVIRFFLDRLLYAPDTLGWWSWYAIFDDFEDRMLVAGVGFKGPPRDGTVEIGYGVVEEFRGRGLASEAVEALVDWGFGDARVERIVAQVHLQNAASQRVLTKAHFGPASAAPTADGMLRFERKRRA